MQGGQRTSVRRSRRASHPWQRGSSWTLLLARAGPVGDAAGFPLQARCVTASVLGAHDAISPKFKPPGSREILKLGSFLHSARAARSELIQEHHGLVSKQ